MTDTKLDLDGMERDALATKDSGAYPVYVLSAHLLALLAKHKATKEREAELRMAICGGEDAPGHNASLSHETILGVLSDNYATMRRDGELAWDGETATSWKSRAVTAEAQLTRAKEALRPFAKVADHFQGLLEQEISIVRAGPRSGNAKLSDLRRARSTLQALEQG